MDPIAEEALASGMRASRRFASESRAHLARVEADRAARLDAIQHLNEALRISEADRAARLEVIERQDCQLAELTERMWSRPGRTPRSTRSEPCSGRSFRPASGTVPRAWHVIHTLEARIVEIPSARATVKRLVELRRARAGPTAISSGVKPCYAAATDSCGRGTAPPPPPRRRRPKRSRPPPEPASELPSVHSAAVEAFVTARGLDGDTDDRALELLYRHGRAAPTVLALQGTDRVLQAAYILARGGAQVSCLGTRERAVELAGYGVAADAAELGDWMVGTGETTLSGHDVILVDAESARRRSRCSRAGCGRRRGSSCSGRSRAA